MQYLQNTPMAHDVDSISLAVKATYLANDASNLLQERTKLHIKAINTFFMVSGKEKTCRYLFSCYSDYSGGRPIEIDGLPVFVKLVLKHCMQPHSPSRA